MSRSGIVGNCIRPLTYDPCYSVIGLSDTEALLASLIDDGVLLAPGGTLGGGLPVFGTSGAIIHPYNGQSFAIDELPIVPISTPLGTVAACACFEAATNEILTSTGDLILANSTQAEAEVSPVGSISRKWTRSSTSAAYCRYASSKAPTLAEWCGSVYVKRCNQDLATIRLQGAYPSRFDASVNLATGEVEATSATGWTIGSASIQPVGNNGWYRVWVWGTCTNTTGAFTLNVSSGTGNEIDSPSANADDCLYVDGGQVELGSYPTPYIETTGSAITRAATDIYTDVTGLIDTTGTIIGAGVPYGWSMSDRPSTSRPSLVGSRPGGSGTWVACNNGAGGRWDVSRKAMSAVLTTGVPTKNKLDVIGMSFVSESGTNAFLNGSPDGSASSSAVAETLAYLNIGGPRVGTVGDIFDGLVIPLIATRSLIDIEHAAIYSMLRSAIGDTITPES